MNEFLSKGRWLISQQEQVTGLQRNTYIFLKVCRMINEKLAAPRSLGHLIQQTTHLTRMKSWMTMYLIYSIVHNTAPSNTFHTAPPAQWLSLLKTMARYNQTGWHEMLYQGPISVMKIVQLIINCRLFIQQMTTLMSPVAYPELVSRGVSKSRKCKWLVKVGASNGVTPPD